MGKLKHLIREIHERSLWQALVVYLGASFAVLEALDMVIEYFGLPRWLWPVAFVLLLVGLPFVVGSSLAHEEEYGDEVPAGAREAAAAEDQRLRVLTWRNAGITFVGALAVWGVVLSGWVLFGGRMSGEGVEAAAFDPAKRVAVLPFSFQGREEYAYLGEGMADLLSAALDGAGEWRTVNARAIEEAVRKRGDMVPGLENSRPVADQVGAGRHVVGEVVEVDGRVRISARLYGPGPEWVSANVEGTPAELFALVDDLTTQFLLATVQSTTGAHPRIAALTTDSLSALKAFLVGEVAYREGRTQDAYASYQRAVEIDSTFALAWYGLSDVAGWVEGATTAQIVRAAELAMQYRDRLPWREQRMVEANLAGWRGDADLAEGLYREVLLADPHDVEARFLLGWLLFQFNHLRGRPTVEAREHLEAVLPYEPEGWEALWFLEVIAALGGDWPAVDSLVQTRRPVMKGQALVWAAARAFALNDTAAQREALEYHADKKPATLHWVAIVTGSFATPEGALPFTKLMAEKADSPDMR
ncbi:MAG: hypothetical protein GWN99_20130, partial [Gemmatimonadetes bacterium]|nr:hypothetical protein [Gemmatimonadota bacterium]NIR76512.1 hypothetical protein [Candidatus Kutchimonas denitrificans]NIS03330.1 hypothetical protein [Gemmatimonadota bacterium]NIT69191.1 hypothetical protein [Gemmatimonadota bacterium]NIU54583.1 hypothetical protein [Gemmatimonadota bacterium]